MPALIRRAPRALWGWRWFRGRYPTWQEAAQKTGGYTDPVILARVLAATLAVKSGQAAYERDSVLFADASPEAGLLANLQRVAGAAGGRLRVLDFGGSLGSTYWRHRPWLGGLKELRWDVVEQPHFVAAGRQYVTDDCLRFFSSLDDAGRESPHDVLLASTVVNYLPEPRRVVADFMRSGAPYLLLHNLALHDAGPDYVMTEHVPPEIYSASYPMWFLNRAQFLAHFSGRYELLDAYASTAVWDRGWFDYPSSGMLLKRLPAHESV